MDALDLARWQFAVTTVYHFLFVPITIGLSAVVAGFTHAYYRTRKPEYLRLAKFLGKLFVINFALGLVTGIVQEFQFGMNWSAYSRFVGDIFGAPLAFEALLAFFMESTFLGMWIFGWNKIPEKLHLASIWLVHIGTVLSAYFILAANSFMQNPVGYRVNETTGRAEMADFVAVLTNKVQLVTFPHVITASYMTAGALTMCVALYKMRQSHKLAGQEPAKLVEGATAVADGGLIRESHLSDVSMYRKAVKAGAWMTLVAGLFVAITGDFQGKIMTEVQPMKMAAAEALYDTPADGKCANFSVLTIGSLDGENAKNLIEVPCLLSFLGTGSFDGQIKGINQVQAEYQAKYAQDARTMAQSYIPNIPMSYWNFRLMIGAGLFSAAFAAFVLFAIRKNKVPTARWLMPLIILTPLAAVLGSSFGWIFTEIGRQPWVVFGEMTTAAGVSNTQVVTASNVVISMVVYTLLYGALAVVEVKLFLDYVKRGAEPFEEPRIHADDEKLAFAY